MRFATLTMVAATWLVGCAATAPDADELDATATTRTATADADCGVDSTERARLLALSPDEFDQDMEGGWRSVADQPGCLLVAAGVLEEYIDTNEIESGVGVMYWHLGQVLALAGESQAAVPWLDAERGTDRAWNLYVDGTIAFLTQDRAALEEATDLLAAVEVPESEKAERRRFLESNPGVTMHEGFVDEPANLNVLRGFLACFDQPYSVAYGCEP